MFLLIIFIFFTSFSLSYQKIFSTDFLSNDLNPVKKINVPKIPVVDKIPVINGKNPLPSIPKSNSTFGLNWANSLLTDFAQALPALPLLSGKSFNICLK